MNRKPFNKIIRGLKEARAYIDREREGYNVTVPPTLGGTDRPPGIPLGTVSVAGVSMTDQEADGGGITLGHLLLAIAFICSVGSLIAQVRYAGGGAMRYLLGLPLAVLLGGLIVWTSWALSRWIWLRSEGHPPSMQIAITLAIFALYTVSIVVAVAAGNQLGLFLVLHISHGL